MQLTKKQKAERLTKIALKAWATRKANEKKAKRKIAIK